MHRLFCQIFLLLLSILTLQWSQQKPFFLFAPWSLLSNFFCSFPFPEGTWNHPTGDPPGTTVAASCPQLPTSTSTFCGLVASHLLKSSQARTDPAGSSSLEQHILYSNREAFSSPKPYNDFQATDETHITELIFFPSLHVCKLDFCQIPNQPHVSW